MEHTASGDDLQSEVLRQLEGICKEEAEMRIYLPDVTYIVLAAKICLMRCAWFHSAAGEWDLRSLNMPCAYQQQI